MHLVWLQRVTCEIAITEIVRVVQRLDQRKRIRARVASVCLHLASCLEHHTTFKPFRGYALSREDIRTRTRKVWSPVISANVRISAE